MNAGPGIVIGGGAGFAGDRIDAALPVIEALATYDCPRYLVYEVLAERTLAIAQRLKLEDPELGYSPWLDHYLRESLAMCLLHQVRIVSNMGSANPLAAARHIQEIAASQQLRTPTVACVLGDDLLEYLPEQKLLDRPTMEGIGSEGRDLIAANAYLGARPIADALDTDADIVIVGRSTDSALVLGPLLHEFGWADNDHDLLAAGITGGHLIECGSQVSGGYFADPGFKDVEGLDETGFPILEMSAMGEIIITKPANTGGVVNRQTVTEQILYEMHDPACYLTPDVVLDITDVEIHDDGVDRIRVSGARGHKRPDTLKATLCFDSGWLAEAEISYAGPNALRRAELAAETVRKRITRLELAGNEPLRVDILGQLAVFYVDGDDARNNPETRDRATDSDDAMSEYRVRVAFRSADKAVAQRVSDELLALYCCGPAGGGGVRQSVTRQLSTASILIERDRVEPNIRVEYLAG